MTCDSNFVWVVGRTLHTAPCLGDYGHRGQCWDQHGHAWTRVAEWLRVDQEALCQPR